MPDDTTADPSLVADLRRQLAGCADVADLDSDPEYALQGELTMGRPRTALGVPLLREGEPIYLCWKAGERSIEHWHSADETFVDRKPLEKEEDF